jgi:NAD dependent epimerase/dehydratase family enzyme
MINKIIIAGANGFLGTSLSEYSQGTANEIVLLARKPVSEKHKNIRWMHWDGESLDR